MKVYIVIKYDGPWEKIDKIFLNEDDANNYCKNVYNQYIEEHDVIE